MQNPAVIKYVLRRKSDGRFFRKDLGHWNDSTWTPDLERAQLYSKVAGVKVALTGMRRNSNWTESNIPVNRRQMDWFPFDVAAYVCQRVAVEVLTYEEPI